MTIDGVAFKDSLLFLASKFISFHLIAFIIFMPYEYSYAYYKICILIYVFALRKMSTTILDRHVG